MTHEEYIDQRRLTALEIAEAVLVGRVGIVEGARSLSCFGDALAGAPDSVLKVFSTVDSDTDHLAVGDERVNWAQEALARQDLELANADLAHREIVLAACRTLIARFGKPVPPSEL